MMSEQTPLTPKEKQKRPWLLAVISGLVGFLCCGILMVMILPSMMIVTTECQQDFDTTLNQLQAQIKQEGWVVVGGKVASMNESLAKQGRDFEFRVSLIKLCHPDYARSVLQTDREMASLMPCSIAVWEGDDGKTYLSKMNVGLMGKLFGGNVAKVMGGDVARDEKRILAGILKTSME